MLLQQNISFLNVEDFAMTSLDYNFASGAHEEMLSDKPIDKQCEECLG
jgi:hypothetical protein